jgi:VWFA-related protein
MFYSIFTAFIFIVLAAAAIVIALYLYRPKLKILRYGSLIALAIIIIGTAGIQVLNTYTFPGQERDNAVEQYMLADWVQKSSDPVSLLHIKHTWEENPNAETKLFYMFSLLKNNRLDEGKNLLEEHISYASDDTSWFDKEAAEQLLSEIDSNRPDSAAVTEEVLPFAGKIDEHLENYKQHTVQELSVDQDILNIAAAFDVNYLQLLRSIDNESELSDIRNEFNSFIRDEDSVVNAHPMVKRELARASIFFGELRGAEELLIDAIVENPRDEEAVSLLAEVYLSGELEPSDDAMQLPQYHHAKLHSLQERIDNFTDWIEQEGDVELTVKNDTAGKRYTSVGFESFANTDDHETDSEVEGVPQYLLDNITLANELTNTLIQSAGNMQDNAKLMINLSRYHFNKGENQEAGKVIHDLLENNASLSAEEQYLVNTIIYNDQKLQHTAAETIFSDRQNNMQEIYEARENLFNNFNTPTYAEEENTAEESFKHFFSESIRNPDERSLSITSVEGDMDGDITMYVNTQNISSLSPNDLEIFDNKTEIEDFTVEKIGEGSDSLERSIGIVLDVSGSMQGDRINIAKSASASFVNRLNDYEQAELVAFDSTPSLVQPFTTDKQALIQGINGLIADGQTNITDALTFEMENLKNQDGHKVLFIFSDGEDNQFSQVESRSRVIDMANQYGISIFAVGFGAGYETLAEVAYETGGEFIAAPNEATISRGFDQIEEMLQSTYVINYQLEDPAEGRHLVTLDYDGIFDQGYYFLGDSDRETPDFDGGTGFAVNGIAPDTIHQTNEVYINVTLQGRNLEELESVKIGNEQIEIEEIIDDQTATLQIPGNLSVGEHLVVAKSNDNTRATAELTVSKAEPNDQIQFGWATLYADWCTPSGNEIKCSGQPSIDQFIYPEGTEMTLEDNEKLTFHGASFHVDQSKLFFFNNMLGEDNVNFNGEMNMTMDDSYGEKFSIDYADGDLSFDKFGIEIAMNDMSYTANRDDEPGTFTSESKLDGLTTNITGNLDLEKFNFLGKVAPFLTSDLGLEATISPTTANIEGSANLQNLKMLGFSIDNPSASIEYDDITKRMAVTANLGTLQIFGFDVKGTPVDGGELTVGFEAPFRHRLGVELTGNVPLGPTGLSLTKAGFLLDYTSRNEQGLNAAVGTVANGPLRSFINKVNSIKIGPFEPFSIDAERANLIQVEAEGTLNQVFTSNWEAASSVDGSLLGFELIKMSGRINNDLLQHSVNVNFVEGENTFVYDDPNYRSLVAYQDIEASETVLGMELSGVFNNVLIPSDIMNSVIKFTGTLGDFEYVLTTDDITLFND